MGSSFWNYVQYGGEATASKGTAVAATKFWAGQMPKVGTDVKVTRPKEMTATRLTTRRSVVYQKQYRNSLSAANATFQQLLFPLSCGLKGSVTASEQTTAQSDYKWTFTPSLTAANNPESATIEMGDDVGQFRVEYSMFDKISLSGSIDQDGGDAAVSVDASFFGRQLSTSAKTAAIALPTGEFMNAKLARLYLNNAWASVGSTELSNLLRSFQIEILTGVHPDSTGSANKYFNAHKEGEISAMASFTIEGGATANSILGYQQAGTFYVARLEIIGSQIGTGVNHKLTFDIGGTIDPVDPIDSEDRGDNLATFTINADYNATGAKAIQVELITDASAWK
jgi:hypothetical protein